MRRIWIVAALAGGCHLRPTAEPPPLAWRLVEVNAALVLEAASPEWTIEARLSREEARAGETVEAEIRLAGARGVHRIELRASRPGVTVEGPTELLVEGEELIRVRFTCATAGRGGILVVVKE